MIKSLIKALILAFILTSANATIEAVQLAFSNEDIAQELTNYQKAIVVFIKGDL